MIRQLLLTLKLLFAEIKEIGQDIRLPYEDPNSRENVHGSYGHRDLVNLPSDSTAENIFTNQELECKS